MSDTLEVLWLCNSLRTNDPSITDLSIQISNRSRLNKALKALEGNVHVSSVTLDLNDLSDPSVQCASLCQYLGKSKVLRSVTLTCHRNFGFSSLPGTFVRALTGNALVEAVTFCGDIAMQYWYDDFLAFLQSKAQSLKRLSIQAVCLTRRVSPVVNWTNELVLAIGSLQALECLTMVHSVGCPLDVVLQRLQSHRRLRMLSISATTNVINLPIFQLDSTITSPLSSFLSNVPLETLELKDFRYTRDQLAPFLHATQRNSARL
jgi:hypothetical protein